MNAAAFVDALAKLSFENVFNPYADTCEVYDLADAAAVRHRNLRTYLDASKALGIDTLWMGRDIGYRGGRRTGLAFTDEYRLVELAKIYPGCAAGRATKGPAVAERSATEIWAVLRVLERPPLLWNVFPLHPHERAKPFTNRKFSAKELAMVNDINASLISWLGIKRIVGIGQDAVSYGSRFGVEVCPIRHPSYGGTSEFREGMRELYGLKLPVDSSAQNTLF